jgi:GNAT superfamily N-acetyltransferase
MYTIPALRGQGIGAELLRQAVAWAREQHLEMIILWPARGREAFYQRGGFVPEPEGLSQELGE